MGRSESCSCAPLFLCTGDPHTGPSEFVFMLVVYWCLSRRNTLLNLCKEQTKRQSWKYSCDPCFVQKAVDGVVLVSAHKIIVMDEHCSTC